MALRFLIRFNLFLGFFIVANISAASLPVWVNGNQQSCISACQAYGEEPLRVGIYNNPGSYSHGQPYYLCSANINNEGFRPGYNLAPNWSNACYVPWNGKEVAYVNYRCYCMDNYRRP